MGQKINESQNLPTSWACWQEGESMWKEEKIKIGQEGRKEREEEKENIAKNANGGGENWK